jgi:hypothetical protein
MMPMDMQCTVMPVGRSHVIAMKAVKPTTSTALAAMRREVTETCRKLAIRKLTTHVNATQQRARNSTRVARV